MDRITKEQRRKNMKAVKSSGSKIEIKLGKALWAEGLRYRKNNKKVFGKPDFTLKRLKIAIFCDGEFWHGKDWEKRKHDIGTNVSFWHRKIERNIQRDREVNQTLEEEGWTVLRFWGKDIEKELESCVEKVMETVFLKEKISYESTSENKNKGEKVAEEKPDYFGD